ncbi:hypothetical protein BU52_24715 [Streptomyces toyocaensis]|uniref:DUF3152 domain-containing protein n=1 Tax=Streptomyces toyocaensis TaxID=55952 RepID=A0A081XM51_STRTO|nr:DUF3152 domain-containing protein [Streptomyces toyocaensis]KES04624.1 hypothetical protein BU52_24715 [Streptomyces toyocaensis]
MGRHSRRGPAPRGGIADTAAAANVPDGREAGGGDRGDTHPGPHRGPAAQPAHAPAPQPQERPPAGGGRGYGSPYAAPPGTPAHGVPRLPDGWLPEGTPAHGVPRFADGTPAHGVPRARGGHPEQREPGGGWGTVNGRTTTGAGYGGMPPAGPGPSPGPGVPLPRQRQAPPAGPREDYLDAFADDVDLFTPRTPAAGPRPPASGRPVDPGTAVTDWNSAPVAGIPADAGEDGEPPAGEPAQGRGGRGRAFTGIAAAAVTTVLAVVVAGQVADERDAAGVQAHSAGEQARDARDPASRGDDRETPAVPSAEPLTYQQKMDRKYPLSATRAGTGTFEAIPGIAKAPGKGDKVTYRVDVEQGLGLDGELFAEAVHRTLNDDRSWAHNGARTFERLHSGRADFVITLASPATTADWCAKSGLDTTEDNVSCDSAATERVMINAYRWAQGSQTYGEEIHAYRQMLINHEIGHRLGYNHVTCDKDGDLAPVMQQQTKFLEHDGIRCRPNPWAYPNS